MSLIDRSDKPVRPGASARAARRRGRMHLGEDILLARHGERIASMRLDRRGNRMVAVLDDGTCDAASNTVLTAAPAPVHRLGAQLDAVRADTSAVDRSELRTLVKFSALWLVISIALTAVVIGISAATGNSEMLQPTLTYPVY